MRLLSMLAFHRFGSERSAMRRLHAMAAVADRWTWRRRTLAGAKIPGKPGPRRLAPLVSDLRCLP
jgi:hypothetical protein